MISHGGICLSERAKPLFSRRTRVGEEGAPHAVAVADLAANALLFRSASFALRSIVFNCLSCSITKHALYSVYAVLAPGLAGTHQLARRDEAADRAGRRDPNAPTSSTSLAPDRDATERTLLALLVRLQRPRAWSRSGPPRPGNAPSNL
jgi:hypothetical protein